ncbi:MAG: hypothetical protein JRJ29_03925 [Deltaproteobacteria bacterium]|nr:hypothetical protein [Deltaproteobacteria bacterium]
MDKSKVSRSGPSSTNAGVILCPTEDDDLAAWHEEIVLGGEYMNDQDWVALMLRELIPRMRDMQEWGVPFERDDIHWLKRVVLRSNGEGITTRLEPIPVYRYPVKPDRFQKSPAPVRVSLKS